MNPRDPGILLRSHTAQSPGSVLHVCAGNQFGGVESMLLCIARDATHPSRRRHTFACCFEGRFSQALHHASTPAHLLPRVRLSRPWEVLRSRAALRRFLTASPPAVVVTHSAWARLVFGRALTGAGTPTVAWIHGASSPLSRMDRWSQRPTPRLVLVNSTFTHNLTRSLFPQTPRQVLYCPVPKPPAVDPASRQRLRQALGVAAHHPVLLTAARLEPWKGHDLLLEGLARLPSELSWTAWIAGGAQTPPQHPYLAHLVERTRSLGLSGKVSFLGERRDLPELMAAADLYCQPNLGPEPFGLAFVEALYAGLPVLTTALGGALEIVTENCGRLVPPGDAAALAGTLETLLRDPGLRARLAAAGPDRATELCDPTQRLGELDRLLSQVA